jgi:LysM repeat protein
MMWLFAGRGAVAEGTAPTTQTVVVQPGQSLWDIAQTVAPKADPRATIYKIKQLNHLTGSDLRAGQALIAPAGS